jgi:hypothetical protein
MVDWRLRDLTVIQFSPAMADLRWLPRKRESTMAPLAIRKVGL